MLVPVELLFLGQEFVGEGFTEVVLLVGAALELAVRELLEAGGDDFVGLVVAVLLGVRILQHDIAHLLSDLLQNFWLCSQILDYYLHDLLHAVVLVPEQVVQEDDLELFLEPRLLRGDDVAPLLPQLHVDLVPLRRAQLRLVLVYFLFGLLDVYFPLFSFSTALFAMAARGGAHAVAARARLIFGSPLGRGTGGLLRSRKGQVLRAAFRRRRSCSRLSLSKLGLGGRRGRRSRRVWRIVRASSEALSLHEHVESACHLILLVNVRRARLFGVSSHVVHVRAAGAESHGCRRLLVERVNHHLSCEGYVAGVTAEPRIFPCQRW